MRNLIKTFSEYYQRLDFDKFQHELVEEIYSTLGAAYANSDGEVKIVTDLCNVINGKSFGKLNFCAEKIHGSRSYVEFSNQDKPVTKELADMVIISIATERRRIIFEKTAFVQNKKDGTEDGIWKIDQDQLYLLHNFPTFKGKKGLLNKNFNDEVIFKNKSEALGNYGLFKSPGEMVLINALNVFKLQQNDKISFSDIKKYTRTGIMNNNSLYPFLGYPSFDECWYKHFKYGLPIFNLPFLTNVLVSYNVYDFVKNWSLFNIGETVSLCGNVFDSTLASFNKMLLRIIGFSDFIDENAMEQKDVDKFENNMIVMVAHLNLDDE